MKHQEKIIEQTEMKPSLKKKIKRQKERNIFLMQTSSSTQSTRVHVIFIGKGNEESYENRNLQILMEFLKINNKGRRLKHLGNSKSVYN